MGRPVNGSPLPPLQPSFYAQQTDTWIVEPVHMEHDVPQAGQGSGGLTWVTARQCAMQCGGLHGIFDAAGRRKPPLSPQRILPR